MDLRRWNDGPDAELEELAGGDLEMLDLSRRLRAARPEPRIDPEFQRRLRAQLMTAAETQLRPRGLARLLRPRPSLFAYGAAGMGGAMIAAAALAYYAPHSDNLTVVQVASAINGDYRINPDHVITISFNHEMDRAAVERGLKIQPAVDYSASWRNNELTIKPRYQLQPNSGYVVTIPKGAARDVKGDVATTDIHITFGTSPATPVPDGKPVGPIALTPHEAGGVADGSLLAFSGDGALLATAGLLPAAGAALAPAPAPALVRYGADGPVRLGDPVTAVALSPAGHNIATLTPSSDGHAVVAVSDTDGSHRSVYSTVADARSPLAWGGDVTHPMVLFVSGGQLTSVDLEHHQGAVAGVHVDPAQTVLLAPEGHHLYIGLATPATGPAPQAAPPAQTTPGSLLPIIGIPGGALPPAPPGGNAGTDANPFTSPSGPGHVVDLDATPGAAPLPLTGLAGGALPGFSADGLRVGWIDSSSPAQPVIVVQPLDGTAATRVRIPAPAAGDSLIGPALDRTGASLAYAVRHGDGGGELRLVRVSDSGLLATAPASQPSELTFSPNGTGFAYLQHSGSQVLAEVASLAGVPGAPGAPSAGTAVPAKAAAAIDALVNAEVTDRSKLHGLVAPAVETGLLGDLPGGLSRGYVISAAPVAGSDAVTAQIRLLRDPTSGHPAAAFTDQTVVLRPDGPAYVVSQSAIRPLHDEPSGPQVVHVDTTRILRQTTVHITFDSDLDPSSVTDSVIRLGGAGSGVTLQPPTYDATSRTVTVTFIGRLRQPLDLTVDVGLRDVNGQGLAAPFTTSITPAP